MNRFRTLGLILFCTVLLFSCQPQVVEVIKEVEVAREEMSVEVEKVVEVEDADGFAQQASAQTEQAQERLIIRTGNLNITVADTEKTIEEISALVNSMGGWVVSSNAFHYGSGVRGSLTIRFPAERFSQTVIDIKDLAIEVNNESSSGQDVTDEFVDLESRLKNLEATADRVRAFLDETETVEEALAVNVELSRLEGEIEVIKGRMKYLSQSAAFSTLTIEIFPDEVAQPIEIDRWLPFEVAEEAIEALASTMQGLANFVIWLLIYIVPVGLVIGVPLFYIGRWVVRNYRSRRVQRTAENRPSAQTTPETD